VLLVVKNEKEDKEKGIKRKRKRGEEKELARNDL
jgi:hypothetical protein